MPTGYTAPVVNGTVTEFKDYAMLCARAFGACISMRDDALDVAIPEVILPSPHYDDQLRKSRERLAELQALTPKQVAEQADASFAEKMVEYDRYEANRREENRRLDDMAGKVRHWTPPTSEHEELKSFMLDQINISRNSYALELPERLEPGRWLAEAIAAETRNIEFYSKQYSDEVTRAAGRTQWIGQLRASLDALDPTHE
jgi:hypothetical protein